MMTTLITVMTLILVAIIAVWAIWPKLRARIEQPKYDFLTQLRSYEDAGRPKERETNDQREEGPIK